MCYCFITQGGDHNLPCCGISSAAMVQSRWPSAPEHCRQHIALCSATGEKRELSHATNSESSNSCLPGLGRMVVQHPPPPRELVPFASRSPRLPLRWPLELRVCSASPLSVCVCVCVVVCTPNNTCRITN